jgi:hypothetical protein
MDEDEVDIRGAGCTVEASGQVPSIMSRLKHPVFVAQLSRFPSSPWAIWKYNMGKGRVGGSPSRPALVATREVLAIRASKGDLSSNSENIPSIRIVSDSDGSSSLWSNGAVDSQEASIVGLDSNSSEKNGDLKLFEIRDAFDSIGKGRALGQQCWHEKSE